MYNIWKDKRNIFLICMIIMQVLLLFYWGGKKEGYNCDEVYSYGLSNSYYIPIIDFDENWREEFHTSDFFKNYLTVEEGERFSYDSVIYNQENDVHPPLFYMILHTVCSFMPGCFTKWQGLGINIFFFVLIILLMYFFYTKAFGDKTEALIVCGIFGFSVGAISNFAFVRMYMMLTFLTLLDGFFHILYSKTKKQTYLFLIYICTVLGCLTHYYFVVVAFFVSLCMCIGNLIKKEWKVILKYAIIRFAGIGTMILLFPACLEHIFFGYRGKGAINSAKSMEGYGDILKAYINWISLEFFGGHMYAVLAVLLFAALLGCIFKYVVKRKKFASEIVDKDKKNYACAMCVVVLLSFFVLTKVSPFTSDRYIMCLYPYIMILFFLLIKKVANFFIKNKKIVLIGIAVFFAIVDIFSYSQGMIQYLYIGTKNGYNIITEHDECNVLYFMDKTLVAYDVLCLEKLHQVYPTDSETVMNMDKEVLDNVCIENSKNPNELLVFIGGDQIEVTLQFLIENTRYNQYEYLMNSGYQKVYCLKK